MSKLSLFETTHGDEIIKLKKRIAELADLKNMILDAESADASLIPFMYQAWLHKAKQLEH